MTFKPHPSQIKAGQIAARVLKEVSKEILTGTKVFKICTLAEKLIIKYGARPAFPCTVSIDHITAHYTSPEGDQTIIPNTGLVKLDVGAQIDGYLSDTAMTIDIDGTLEGFVAATDDALEEAIEMMQPGASLGEVGKRIEKIISKYGLKPIKNLSGHDMKRYRLHGGKAVPNVKKRDAGIVELGECYAIEPYATNGAGTVVDSDLVFIFQNTGKDESIEGNSEKLRIHLREKYGPYPFTSRWVGTASKEIDLVESFRELLKFKAIRGIPVQISRKGRPVSQSEHTIFISKEGPIVLTKRD